MVTDNNNRLNPYADHEIVAIRRQYGTAIYWYRRSVGELGFLLDRAANGLEDPEDPLVVALGLHESDGLPAVQLSEVNITTSTDNLVVLAGHEFVGFLDGEPPLESTGSVWAVPPGTAVPTNGGSGHYERGANGDDDSGEEEGSTTSDQDTGEIVLGHPPEGEGDGGHRRSRGEGKRGGRPRSGARTEAAVSEEPDRQVFSAYPRIDAPDRVEPEEEFQLLIGLSKVPVPGVEGTAVRTSLPRGVREFGLEIQVTAEGFTSAGGWSKELKIRIASFDESTVAFTLRAPMLANNLRDPLLAVLLVHFTRDGVECGTAWKRIVVAPAAFREPEHLPGAQSFWVTGQARPVLMSMPSADFPVPDLTIRIENVDGNPATGFYGVTFLTPYAVPLPPEPLRLNLEQDAPSFARGVISLIDTAEGTPLIKGRASGVARLIANKLPPEFWKVLADVAAAVSRRNVKTPMSVLLLSAEASVPWELAKLPQPLDPARPNYLGAQVAIGRWILGDSGPPLPPKNQLSVTGIAAISPYYQKDSRISQLPGARKESVVLQQKWGAVAVDATPQNLADLLTGQYKVNGAPASFQAIHIACHGQVFPNEPERTAVLLEDGTELNAIDFLDAAIGKQCAPLLFLNACQVGTASVMLGENVGFAGCSLHAGFTAFIGPLWSVNDGEARNIAEEFYRRAFKGDPVAEILRDIRATFTASPPELTATPLAYVFYGNPALSIVHV